MAGVLRERATAVVIKEGRVLLVRGKGTDFMMPGGGIDPGEPPIDAVVRELREETGLRATNAQYIFSWDSPINRHRVFRVEAEGDVEIGPEEITDFLWWDQKGHLPTYPHVEAILTRL